jgi:hypothetical protein
MELDHVFICTERGAPEAEKLVTFGLHEGPASKHAGQGTANRRFPFANAMVELLWVSDTEEVQSENTRRTQLWERWCERKNKASPFGICLRPEDDQEAHCPFPSWIYHPIYLPSGVCMSVGNAGIEEPMWVYLSFMRRDHHRRRFMNHPSGIREITALTLTTPAALRSPASERIVEAGILKTRRGQESLLEIEFDGNRRKERVDFRPHLPLIFHV